MSVFIGRGMLQSFSAFFFMRRPAVIFFSLRPPLREKNQVTFFIMRLF
jgi:hypothetical protein